MRRHMPARSFHPNEVSAGGVVVRRGEAGFEVCLINDGRHWGLPKGIVERGETPEHTAVREISEETGLPAERLRVLAALAASEYVYRREGRLIFKRVHHFLVEAPDDAPLHPDPAEVVQAEWLAFDAALARVSFRDTVAALGQARAILEPAPHGRAASAP